MSVDQDSSTSVVYVRLLDEGTVVFRPTEAVFVAGGMARLVAPGDYDCDDEHWEFAPDSVVRIETRILHGKEVSVAVALAR
jgi:hypothetical protein